MPTPDPQPGCFRYDAIDRAAGTAPLVLVVSASSTRRGNLALLMERDDLACGLAGTVEDARTALRAGSTFEAVVMDVQSCDAASLRFIRELTERRIASLIVCPSVSFDDAVEAMRAGAADIVPAASTNRELSRRVRCAVQQRRLSRAHEIRLEEAARLNPSSSVSSPPPASAQEPTMEDQTNRPTGSPGNDSPASIPTRKAPARPRATRQSDYIETPEDRTPAALAHQFEVTIRHELDVESLLRQVLEFVLANLGPTNAAIFLPGTSGDFSLGAYVNYSCPKETAEVLLDHLANVAAPALENTTGVLHFKTADELNERFGDGCDWLDDCSMLAFTCRAEGDTLAVFTLFRERSTPFSADAPALLARLADVFGRQLGRVVRIHHRHLPRDKWGGLGDPSDSSEDGGLAA